MLCSFLADAVHELLSKYTKVTIRRPINAAFISPDEIGLQTLMANENFRAALDLTERLLTSLGQGRGTAGHISKNSVHSLRLWHARFTLFAKVSCIFSSVSVQSAKPEAVSQVEVFFKFSGCFLPLQ